MQILYKKELNLFIYKNTNRIYLFKKCSVLQVHAFRGVFSNLGGGLNPPLEIIILQADPYSPPLNAYEFSYILGFLRILIVVLNH